MFKTVLTVALVIFTASSASAGERYELRDRSGKFVGTVREPTGPVLNRWEVRDRAGRLTHTLREPTGPVLNRWEVRDRDGKVTGSIRCAPGAKC
ncbi:MAG: hypothetical protein GEU87_02460 [Alphaproteobacteria bacterium]|nr:hypothetical protein [Alphaproteobacteria bacterium]